MQTKQRLGSTPSFSFLKKKKKGFLGLQQRHGNYDQKNDDMAMELQ